MDTHGSIGDKNIFFGNVMLAQKGQNEPEDKITNNEVFEKLGTERKMLRLVKLWVYEETKLFLDPNFREKNRDQKGSNAQYG